MGYADNFRGRRPDTSTRRSRQIRHSTTLKHSLWLSGMEKTTIFWQEVRRRRNRFFLCWIGWLPVSAGVVLVYQALCNHEPSTFVLFGLLVGWAVIWHLTMRQLTALTCPRCRKPAIAHPMFFMRDARCRHCGLANANS